MFIKNFKCHSEPRPEEIAPFSRLKIVLSIAVTVFVVSPSTARAQTTFEQRVQRISRDLQTNAIDIDTAFERVHQYSPLRNDLVKVKTYAADWDLDGSVQSIVYLIAEPGLLIPTWGQSIHDSRASDKHEGAARVILSRMFSDEKFFEHYVWLVLWSQLFVTKDDPNAVVSQQETIAFTLAGIDTRISEGDSRFFYQDYLHFACLAKAIGYRLDTTKISTPSMQQDFLRFKDWLTKAKFKARVSGGGWEVSEDGFGFKSLPAIKLPSRPFANPEKNTLTDQQLARLQGILRVFTK